MASTIKIKNSSTAGAVPGTGDLVQGELAINVTDRRIFTENASGTVVELGTPSIDDNGNATAITIDSSENVGIGTSSPSYKLDVVGQNRVTMGGSAFAFLMRYDSSSAPFIIGSPSANAMSFSNSDGTERMRIDSSGNLLVGSTTTNGSGAPLSLSRGGANWGVGPNSGGSLIIYNASGTGQYMTNGGTTWNSSSDERLKTQLTPFENAAEKVCSLRAGTGRYLTDEESVSRSFLIAQDVQAVLPEAVNVQDDEQGTLGLAYTDLIPLLTAAIQELKATVDAQAARITALEQA